jgi:hypothetical protein
MPSGRSRRWNDAYVGDADAVADAVAFGLAEAVALAVALGFGVAAAVGVPVGLGLAVPEDTAPGRAEPIPLLFSQPLAVNRSAPPIRTNQ